MHQEKSYCASHEADADHENGHQFAAESVDETLSRRYEAIACASLLRETMWSMVSEIHSTLDFDYVAYTDENLARFERSYTAFDGAT